MNSAWPGCSSPFHLFRPLFLHLATHNYQQHTYHHCQFPIGLDHTKLDPHWLLSHPDVLSAHRWLGEADVWRLDWWRTRRGVLCFCGSVAVVLRKISVHAVIPTITHTHYPSRLHWDQRSVPKPYLTPATKPCMGIIFFVHVKSFNVTFNHIKKAQDHRYYTFN